MTPTVYMLFLSAAINFQNFRKHIFPKNKSASVTRWIYPDISSNYNDVAASVPLAQNLTRSGVNLFIVGMNSARRDYLSALSGSVFMPTGLDRTFANNVFFFFVPLRIFFGKYV